MIKSFLQSISIYHVLLILFSLLILVAVFSYDSDSKYYKYYISCNISGVANTAPDIFMNGVKVGYAQEYEVKDRSVIFKVFIKNNIHMSKDSVFDFFSVGVLSSLHIRVTNGIRDEYYQPNDTIYIYSPPRVDMTSFLFEE